MKTHPFIILAMFTAGFAWNPESLRAEENYANLSQIHFEETPLSVVIEFFRAKSAEGKWTKRGIDFIIDTEIDQEQLISLRLNDIPIGIAIIYMIDSADLDYKINDHVCQILPRGEGELAKRLPSDPRITGKFAPAIKARKPLPGRVEFSEAPIQLIADYISERQGFNLILNQRIDPDIPVSIQRDNVSSAHFLRSIADLASLEIRVEPYAIFLDPPGTKALHLARIKTARLQKLKSAPRKSQRKGGYGIGVYPNDPRSPVHPDYVKSTDPDVSKRTNALNNVYKWVNGKWTFVRAGSSAKNRGLRTSTLETDK